MFPNRVSQKTRKRSPKPPEKSAIELMQEYADTSTIHGIQHIFRQGESWSHRLIWTIAFVGCTVMAGQIVKTRWDMLQKTPTSTVVEDTQTSLGTMFFPSVALCPTNKIQRSRAISYIAEHVSNTSVAHDGLLDEFLSALTLMEHPHYERMEPHLVRAAPLLVQLKNINLTDLMVQAMPKCEEIIELCWWHGLKRNCCGEDSKGFFGLQRSEEGFCYAFNSLTAQKNKNCKTGVKCGLLKSPSSGRGTGLEISVTKLNESDAIIDAIKIIDIQGIKVQVNNVAEFPEAGMGILVPIGHRSKMVSTVKPTLTNSSAKVRTILMSKRGCYFKDENHLRIASEYTFKNCLIQCRMDFIKNICGCLPYYFNEEDKLRIFYPTDGVSHGFDESEVRHSLKCTHCFPLCSEARYDVDMDVTKEIFSGKHQSFMEFYYKSGAVVLYQKKVTFDSTDFLVSCGGICGLFLGSSLLSLVELAYWTLKAAVVWVMAYWHKRHPNHNLKFKKEQMHGHLW